MKQTIVLPLASEILFEVPTVKFDRRLGDKILAAFAHAYETGETGVAAILRRALEEAERAGADARVERRRSDSLRQADLLCEFVDARNVYKRVTGRTPQDRREVEQAGRDMLEAYRRWSDS